ncbi:MAG: MBL fold metallo-hydrolase [Gemmatimonadaceae bacterium]
MAPRLRLRCWGARGTLPSPGPQALRYGGHTSCIEIQPANGARVIFDAGSGIRALGAEILRAQIANPNIKEDEIIHLFLTHQHFDHVIGLPHFQPLRSENNHVILRCGNATPDQLRELVRTVLAPPLFVEMPMLASTLSIESCELGVPMPAGDGCAVHRIDARHNGGAAIFRIDDAQGAAVAFAPDNELSYASNDPAVMQWRAGVIESLRNIPLLLHDAMYHDAEVALYAGWGHSSAEEATQLAVECNAQRLVLFHHHPDRTDSEIDDLVWTCRSLAHRAGSRLQIDAAYEGMTLTV